MKSFKRYLEDQNESPPMPVGDNPLSGPDGGISSAPASTPLSSDPAGGGGMGMPMGGPSMSSDMSSNPIGSPGQSNQNASLKLKAYNVWDVLEKILN